MTADQQPRLRLNPFAFPSETKGRFLMLTLAALAFGDNLASLLYLAFRGIPRLAAISQASTEMVREHWSADPLNTPPVKLSKAAKEGAAVMTGQMAPLVWEWFVSTGAVLLLLALVSLAIYRRHTRRLRSRYGSKRLTRLEAPGVVGDLERISSLYGVPLPVLEYSPGLAQGHAFGRKGEEVLLLQGTPEMLERSWTESSRAIALHELGHIANGDGQEREKAKALWLTFALFLCSVLALFWNSLHSRLTDGLLAKCCGMLLLVWGIWAGLIRIREFYADWRAASWGTGPTLEDLLSLPEGRIAPWERWDWWWRAWGRWGEKRWWQLGWQACEWVWYRSVGLLSLHPSFKERAEVLRDSRRLFRISPDLAFLTGVLLTLVLGGAIFLLMRIGLLVLLLLGTLNVAFLRQLSSLPVGDVRSLLLVAFNMLVEVSLLLVITAMMTGLAFLVARTIGTQIQRRAVAELADGWKGGWGYARLIGPAFLLAIGMEVGFLISPFSVFALRSVESWKGFPVLLLLNTAIMWLWLVYSHGLSRMLLGSHFGSANPSRRRMIIDWVSIVVLTVLFWPATFARLSVKLASMLHMRERLPMGIDPQTFYVYAFFMTTLVLMILAMVLYFVFVLGTLAIVRLGPMREHRRCPSCREESPFVLGVGRCCHSCGELLSPWAFVQGSGLTGVEGI